MALQVTNGLVVIADDELKPFISHPSHGEILEKGGLDVELRDGASLPEPYEGKYDLRVIESLLIQSR